MISASEKRDEDLKQKNGLDGWIIPKKKTKKGKRIIAGNTFGIYPSGDKASRQSQQSHRSIPTANSHTNGNVTRKNQQATRSAAPFKNLATSTNKKRAKNIKKNINDNHGKTFNGKEKKLVVASLKKSADFNAFRAAVESERQEKLKDVLGDIKLELNHQGQFVVPTEAARNHKYNKLRKILQKNHLPGFLEWMEGRKGWLIATDKSPYLEFHRRLHDAYKEKMLALLKEAKSNPRVEQTMRVLYYKEDRLSQENSSIKRQQTLWKKVPEKGSLQDAVGMIRPFLEVIKYFMTDPKDKWTSLPWLMPTITQQACQTRLNRISSIVFSLLRTSHSGPDVPVHWAAHPALNSYSWSVVTEETMTELVVGVANLLGQLFLPYPTIVSDLNEVTKMLESSIWSGNDVGGKTAPSSDSTEPITIDLTGLSLSD